MKNWTNWAGNVVASPAAMVRPASVDELRAAVAGAVAKGHRVRVAGSGHSFVPLCETNGVLIDVSKLSGIESIDPATGDALIWAGTKLYDIGEPLLMEGRALPNQGDIDRQALAGAVSTGTHGTGRKFGSFSSMVRSLDLITATGDLITIDASTADDLRAANLSLGMLGVIARIRLSTVPAFKLHERSQALDFETCLEAYPEAEETNRHAEFWWIPSFDTCVLKTLTETNSAPTVGSPDPEYPPGTIERYLRPEQIDWSYRVYPSIRSQQFVECENAVPLSAGPDAMRAIRTMMRKRYPEVTWVVEYRAIPAGNSLLSPTQGVESVTISVHHKADADWKPFMQDSEALFREHGGRPHWGKLHWLTRADVDVLYPDIDRFRAIRHEYDPGGFFLNDHLAPLFG